MLDLIIIATLTVGMFSLILIGFALDLFQREKNRNMAKWFRHEDYLANSPRDNRFTGMDD